MARALRVLLAAATISVVAAAPAAAHPTLTQAAPAPGLSLPEAPSALTLAYSEAPVARGSSIVLRRAGGARLPLSAPQVDGKALTATVPDDLAPGVYDVRWVVLGDDGHTTSGRFRFGVAGKDGAPPPGAERLAGAGGAGTGRQSAAAQDAISVVARWLLIVAASVLLGGFALGARAGDLGPWRRVAPFALLLALAAAVEGVLAAAGRGAAGSLDFGLVTATEVGVAALVRLVVLAVGASVAIRSSRRRVRDWCLVGAGGLALASTAFDGHVVSAPSPVWAALGQLAHVLAAGTWVGAALMLGAHRARAVEAARRFAPIAVATLGAAVATGVVAALREVDGWYFLRWSDYGRAVIVKSALVLGAAGLGAYALRRRRSLHRMEAAVVVLVAGVASLLAALPQGRGQALPAQRGTLMAGPAFATVVAPGGATGAVTLAPARAGVNRLVLTSAAGDASVRLVCACAERPVRATLSRTSAGTLAADVRLPADGTWYAYVTLGDKPAASPAALPVGVPEAPGAPPVEVLAVADLSGPDAVRCRELLLGLQLAVGRQNALGGLEGGRKVALRTLDSGGSATRAGALALTGRRPLALAGACGEGAGAAVAAASRDGIPSVIGDPGVPAIGGTADAFRVTGDPAAEGYAAARYLRDVVLPTAPRSARTVRLVGAADEAGRRWASGWRAGLEGTSIRVQRLPASAFAQASPKEVDRTVDRRHALAVGIDGPPSLARALARAHGPANIGYAPAAVLASARTFTESFVEDSGVLGRLGVVRGASEIAPDGRDALAYARALGQLFPGERPSLQGIRGYVTGLALGAAVKQGTSPADVTRALRRPRPFTDSLTAPWRSDAPSLGGQRFAMLGTTFQAATLIPQSAGGEAYSGTYFRDGAWSRLSSRLYGPPLDAPPLGG